MALRDNCYCLFFSPLLVSFTINEDGKPQTHLHPTFRHCESVFAHANTTEAVSPRKGQSPTRVKLIHSTPHAWLVRAQDRPKEECVGIVTSQEDLRQ